MFDKNQNLFEFLEFPRQIHRSLYTTNLIEGFNMHLKRYTRRKEQFPNEESLDRFVGFQVIEYNLKGNRRIHKGFDIVQSEIETLFEEKYHYYFSSTRNDVYTNFLTLPWNLKKMTPIQYRNHPLAK